MPERTEHEVLRAAAELVDGHRATPDLPVDLAVHTALLLDGEAPSYTELCRSDRPSGALVFTLVTGTRVLQLTAAEPPRDGGGISADVWELSGLRELRRVGGTCREGSRQRWLLTFAGAPPLRLPVAVRPSAVHEYAASRLTDVLVPRPAPPAD